MAERRSDNICTNSMSYMQHSLQWNTATSVCVRPELFGVRVVVGVSVLA